MKNVFLFALLIFSVMGLELIMFLIYRKSRNLTWPFFWKSATQTLIPASVGFWGAQLIALYGK